jgi:DNA repair photolyase
MNQSALFLNLDDPPAPRRPLPVLGARLDTQKDIVYYEAAARSVLNPPESTGIGCWSLNPYVGCAFGCAYCYARYAHRYAMERGAGARRARGEQEGDEEQLPPWLAFERRVLVKRDAPALVRRALGGRSARYRGLLSGEAAVVIGTATDPYQPAERRFRVTRGVLEALAEHAGLDVVIITKSPLVTRDVDVLARIAERSELSVHVSLITLDRTLARRIEPRSPTPEARLRAVARLSAAGIDVGINCMPVLPGITDVPADLAALVRRAAECGARHLGAGALRLQPAARDRYLPWIAAEFPELAARYRAAYAHGHHAGERYRAGLQRLIAKLCARHGIRVRTYGSDADAQRASGDVMRAPGGPAPLPAGARASDRATGDGLLAPGAITGRLPDGQFPNTPPSSRRRPGVRVPDVQVPDGRVPDADLPDGAVPNGMMPNGAAPDGSHGRAGDRPLAQLALGL